MDFIKTALVAVVGGVVGAAALEGVHRYVPAKTGASAELQATMRDYIVNHPEVLQEALAEFEKRQQVAERLQLVREQLLAPHFNGIGTPLPGHGQSLLDEQCATATGTSRRELVAHAQEQHRRNALDGRAAPYTDAAQRGQLLTVVRFAAENALKQFVG